MAVFDLRKSLLGQNFLAIPVWVRKVKATNWYCFSLRALEQTFRLALECFVHLEPEVDAGPFCQNLGTRGSRPFSGLSRQSVDRCSLKLLRLAIRLRERADWEAVPAK